MMKLVTDKLSKAPLEERKKSWEDVRARLEYSDLHTKAELKIFESYYLRGKQSKMYPMLKDPIPLVYRLWLCPDQSIASWRAITNQLLAGPTAWLTDISIAPVDGDDGGSWQEVCKGNNWGWQIRTSLLETDTILWQHACADRYNGVVSPNDPAIVAPLGFMGGIEKKIFDFLAPFNCPETRLEYRGKPLFDCSGTPVFIHPRYYYELCVWLDAKKPHNPYILSIYMAEHWYAELSDEFMQRLQDKTLCDDFVCYLQLIARYPKPVSGLEFSERHVYCEKLRNILDSRPIPSVLQEFWLAAKNYDGLIDLNGHYFKHPDTDRPENQPEHYYVGDFSVDVAFELASVQSVKAQPSKADLKAFSGSEFEVQAMQVPISAPRIKTPKPKDTSGESQLVSWTEALKDMEDNDWCKMWPIPVFNILFDAPNQGYSRRFYVHTRTTEFTLSVTKNCYTRKGGLEFQYGMIDIVEGIKRTLFVRYKRMAADGISFQLIAERFLPVNGHGILNQEELLSIVDAMAFEYLNVAPLT